MRRLLLVLLVVALPSLGMSPKTKRHLTFAAVTVAQMLDVHSSLGRREGNPLLRGPNGRFDAGRGLGVKLGILSGMLAAQELRPNSYWNWVNLTYAGASTAIAVRNYRLSKPPEYLGPAR
jgi:hypothetical protein